MAQTKPTTIYELLKNDHDTVKGLFHQILDSKKPSKIIFSKIQDDLTVHMQGEEKLFYPTLEKNDETKELVFEAYEEHQLGKDLLKEINGMQETEERWMAKLKVLSDIFEHHVQEEEEEIFPQAQKILGDAQEQEMLQQFMQLKAQHQAGDREDVRSGGESAIT